MDRRPTAFALAIALLAVVPTARIASADLLIANVGTNSILRYDEAANTLSTFSSGDNGALNVPHGMTYGPDGNLYVSSLGTGSILEYNGQTGAFLGTFVPHTVGAQTLQYPNGIAFDPNNPRYFYIASFYDNAIERYDTVAKTLSVYASLPASADAAAHLQGPTGLVFGFDGKLYVNNSTPKEGSEVRQYDVQAGDTAGRAIISGPSTSTHLVAPAQLTFAPSAVSNLPLLIDTSFYQGTVNAYQLSNPGGTVAGSYLQQVAGGLNQPGGVAYDPLSGRLMIANYLGNSLVAVADSILAGSASGGPTIATTLNPTSIDGAAIDRPTYILAMPTTPTPAPEPAALTLFGVGLLAYLGSRLRRRRVAA